MRLDKATEIVKKWEGCRLEVYTCPSGYPTIGFGHRIVIGEDYSVITQEQADEILAKDLAVRAKQLKKLIKYPYVSENEFNALLSWVFNVGITAAKNSTLVRLYNAGEIASAADELLKWCISKGKKSKGLLARRRDERKLFLQA